MVRWDLADSSLCEYDLILLLYFPAFQRCQVFKCFIRCLCHILHSGAEKWNMSYVYSCLCSFTWNFLSDFDVLLTVHLSIFILVINQLHAKNYVFQWVYFLPLHVSSTCAHHREVKIVLYSLWCHHTYRWPSRAQSSLNQCKGRPPTSVMIPDAV